MLKNIQNKILPFSFYVFIVVIFILGVSHANPEDVLGTWWSLIPPIVAIFIALAFKQVVLALFVSIWSGAWILSGMNVTAVGEGFLNTISDHILPAAANPDHMSIILFSLLIGGMVGVITDNGGTRGVIAAVTNYVKTRVAGQVATSIMGFIVFFDDYANTMVVGNTMRPLTDKLKISRAKLAYLVDSTAAPVATVALVSTWIGAMVGYIQQAEDAIPGFAESPYLTFVNSLPYNFYAFFTIFFVMVIAISGRDFGPMLNSRVERYKAEFDPKYDKYQLFKDKLKKDEVEKPTSSAWNATIPILVLVIGTITGLFATGEGSSVQDIIASADSYSSLLWGSLCALAVAIVMTVAQKMMKFEDTVKAMMNGMHIMFDGLLVLVMAWGLSEITGQLKTADFLIDVFQGNLDPIWLPAIVLVFSFITSFATGSSWGTMGILMPLVLPLTYSLCQELGISGDDLNQIFYAATAAVLAGSVWGDHCSPISDTTILSSIATQCDHLEHVKTQLPYAMVTGLTSLIVTYLVINLGVHWSIGYLIGIAAMSFIIWKWGKTPEPADYSDQYNTAEQH
jgi:Na+/H+ antiporter NhaC